LIAIVNFSREHVVGADVLVVTDEDIWMLFLKDSRFLCTAGDSVDEVINLYTVLALVMS